MAKIYISYASRSRRGGSTAEDAKSFEAIKKSIISKGITLVGEKFIPKADDKAKAFVIETDNDLIIKSLLGVAGIKVVTNTVTIPPKKVVKVKEVAVGVENAPVPPKVLKSNEDLI